SQRDVTNPELEPGSLLSGEARQTPGVVSRLRQQPVGLFVTALQLEPTRQARRDCEVPGPTGERVEDRAGGVVLPQFQLDLAQLRADRACLRFQLRQIACGGERLGVAVLAQ